MNEISPDDGPAGLDPDLVRLFDEAVTHGSPGPRTGTQDEAFVGAVLRRLQAERRRRLLLRSIPVGLIIVLGAVLAPYVAQATLTVMGSIAIYPLGCVCAALIAWRTALRFN